MVTQYFISRNAVCRLIGWCWSRTNVYCIFCYFFTFFCLPLDRMFQVRERGLLFFLCINICERDGGLGINV